MCELVLERASEMTVSTILGILGIIVSLCFGAWGVLLVLRRSYPGEITFVKERSIPLFDAIVKNLPEMAVLYRGAPVNPNVVLIEGYLVNTGSKDISSSMVEMPITLSLPEGARWLSASVISASRDVKALVNIPNPNAIVLINSLFRCNEYVRFQALAELAAEQQGQEQSASDSIERRLEKSLKFEHR